MGFKRPSTWGNKSPTGRALFGARSFQPIATQAVGQYAPNGYGLHDMAGSVWRDSNALLQSETQEASEDARIRAVVRGRSWGSPAEELRVAFRQMRLVCAVISLSWAFAVFGIISRMIWFLWHADSLIQKNSNRRKCHHPNVQIMSSSVTGGRWMPQTSILPLEFQNDDETIQQVRDLFTGQQGYGGRQIACAICLTEPR